MELVESRLKEVWLDMARDIEPDYEMRVGYEGRRIARAGGGREMNASAQLYFDVHKRGISTELVEAYALARDAYGESVRDFGEARAKLGGNFPLGGQRFAADRQSSAHLHNSFSAS